METAGSSLLYSKEFYETVARRLTPDGIFQQWVPREEIFVLSAITKSLLAVSPHLRVFRALEGHGLYMIASMKPIMFRNADDLARQLPPRATKDVVEWGPYATPTEQFKHLLENVKSVERILAKGQNSPMLTDDQPVNEYYLLRSFLYGTDYLE